MTDRAALHLLFGRENFDGLIKGLELIHQVLRTPFVSLHQHLRGSALVDIADDDLEGEQVEGHGQSDARDPRRGTKIRSDTRKFHRGSTSGTGTSVSGDAG